MATAPKNQESDGPISPGVPYDKFMRRFGEQAKGVDSTSCEYDCMLPKWERIQAVLDGTDAMRTAGEKYLPRHEYEGESAYKERLGTSVLDNWTSRTLETLVGKAFRDPPQLLDLPKQVEDILKDMDGSGTSAVAMAQAWFREAVAKREAWLFVDFTRGLPRADGLPRTLEDDRRDGLRPLWRLVCPEHVLFKQGETIQGRFRWTQVRVSECTMEPDGEFGEMLVERIRVHRPGTWELYRKVRDNRRRWKWVLEDAGATGLAEIPAYLFRVDGDKPPLEDLAHLNITHWQSGSDQRSILTTSRFAMLAASGAPPVDPAAGEKPLIVGPKQWLSMPDPQGKFYYVEHTGAAINSGRTDLQDLEQRMASYGAEFLKRQPGRASATGRALDSSEAQSLLQTWVRQFGEALGHALVVTARWLRLPDSEAGNVKFELAADVDATDATEVTALTQGRQRGDISRVAWLTEMKRRGFLPDDFDIEKDKELIDQELVDGSILGGMFGGASGANNGNPDPSGKSPGAADPTKN